MSPSPKLDPAATTSPSPARAGVRASVALGIGLLLIALNLRIGVAAVGPVLDDIRADEGLSAAAASLLTAIPVLAFGAFAFVTPGLTRRVGMHQLLGVAIGGITLGILLRWPAGIALLFLGTLVLGAAIAVANVLLPAVIKQDFAHRTGVMMGLYSTALFVGAALSSGLTVPLMGHLSGSAPWRPAMALWAVPAVIACVFWLPWALRRPRAAAGESASSVDASPGASAGAASDAASDVSAGAREPTLRALLRDRTALAVTSTMGIQSLSYYATLTWIPTLLRDAGLSEHAAGWMLSYSSFPGIVAGLSAPTLARRLRPAWLPVALAVILLAGGYVGLMSAPASATYLWMTLLGLGQGASISLSLSFIVWRSPDTRHTAHLSTMAQGCGYLVAGLGPVGFGALHSATNGWTVPLAALLALLVLQFVTGVGASRDRHVLAPR